MKIEVVGNININYVQSLCLLFFPGAKFPEDEEADVSVPYLKLNVERKDDGIFSKAELAYNGKNSRKEHFVSFSDTVEENRCAKISVGVAVYKVCEEIVGISPPWGILTGIRPSKVAMGYMNKGMTPDEVINTFTGEYGMTERKAKLSLEVAVNESEIINSIPDDTCSIYVSIPFCPSRCTYCSFVSYSTKKLLDLIPDYLEALVREIDFKASLVRDLKLKVLTIYIGGGTPTVLTENQLRVLLSKIRSSFDFSLVREFTLEAGRPDTITAEKLEIAKEYGVNRISINPQTLDETVLSNIGRNHSVADFFDAYCLAESSGIENINVDLIAGLPGDNYCKFKDTVENISKLNPQNVTLHTFCVKRAAQLTTSGNTTFIPADTELTDCVDFAYDTFKNCGYVPYYMYRQKNTKGNLENTGYAKPGSFGIYNILIMEEVHSIFAIGAGAVTKLVSKGGVKADSSRIERVFAPKYPYEYLDQKYNNIDNTMHIEKKIKDFYMEYCL